jgi:hypothetical protein
MVANREISLLPLETTTEQMDEANCCGLRNMRGIRALKLPAFLYFRRQRPTMFGPFRPSLSALGGLLWYQTSDKHL